MAPAIRKKVIEAEKRLRKGPLDRGIDGIFRCCLNKFFAGRKCNE
jgi:hypothetical protein